MTHTFSQGRGTGRARQGFTLIELLVVIAIIAILAAILFPVFARAREKARQTTCLSNEKQIGLALLQYTNDFDEMLPQVSYWPGASGSPNDPNVPKWMDSLYTYVKSTQAFDCPDAIANALEFVPCTINSVGLCSNRNGYRLGTYGINATFPGGRTATGGPFVSIHGPVGLPVNQILVPATTVFVTELEGQAAGYSYGYKNATVGWNVETSVPDNITAGSPAYLDTLATGATVGKVVALEHSEGTNVLWCDGHAKWMTGAGLVAKHNVSGKLIPYLWTIEDD